MTDLRGSAAYRRAMIGRLLEKFFAETRASRRGAPREHARSVAAGAVGASVPHESARSGTSPAARYTSTTCGRTSRTSLHAWPVMAPHAHARVRLDRRRAARSRCRACSTVLTAAESPARTTSAPARHDEPLFPTRGAASRPAVAWVIAETEEARARRGAVVAVEYEPLPADPHDRATRSPPSSFLTDADACTRGDADAALATAPHRLEGELAHRRPGALLSRDQRRARVARRRRRRVRPLVDAAPAETQEVVARVLGVPRNKVIVQCLRMGGALRRQGGAGQRVGRRRRARRVRRPAGRCACGSTRELDMVLTGKRHPFLARFRVGFDGRRPRSRRCASQLVQRRRLVRST